MCLDDREWEYHDDDYDDADDGRQQLEEYEEHCREIERKARALLTDSAAMVRAREFAKNLARLVDKHPGANGDATTADLIFETVAEHIVDQALQDRHALLLQPVNRDGNMAIRAELDDACEAFEKLLSKGTAK